MKFPGSRGSVFRGQASRANLAITLIIFFAPSSIAATQRKLASTADYHRYIEALLDVNDFAELVLRLAWPSVFTSQRRRRESSFNRLPVRRSREWRIGNWCREIHLEALAKLHFFSVSEETMRPGKLRRGSRSRNLRPPKMSEMQFFAQADIQLNQKTMKFHPCGWSETLMGALAECMREFAQVRF